jgi:hypothetical protein
MGQFIQPTVEKKRKVLRTLQLSWAVYWVVLLVGMPVAVSLDAAVWFLLVAFAAAVWLAMSVAEAAAATGGAPGVWGAGTFFLGPFGSLFFPWYQLYRLRASM